ncbi:MAG TPA: HAD family phosphatase [Bacillota bacterium]|nr:HAD family phosphatase [Bacillota bacterium]
MEGQIGVIFDMDGVIVDTNPYHKKAWQSFCNRYGVFLSDREFKTEVFGRINKNALKYIFNKQLTFEEIEKYSAEKEKIFCDIYQDQVRPVNGLVNFLTQLQKEPCFKIGLATSAPKGNMDLVLDKLNLRGFFAVLVDASLVKEGKPNPEIFFITSRLLGTPPEDCIVFEDSISGINAATNAGMKTVGLTTTHPREELPQTKILINDFTEIDVKTLRCL